MILNANNIGRFGNLTAEFNGLTVIAGINASGKSTIGKSLYLAIKCLAFLETNLDYEKFYTMSKSFRDIHDACDQLILIFDKHSDIGQKIEGVKSNSKSLSHDIDELLHEPFNIFSNSKYSINSKRVISSCIRVIESFLEILEKVSHLDNGKLVYQNFDDTKLRQSRDFLKSDFRDFDSIFLKKLLENLVSSEFKNQISNIFNIEKPDSTISLLSGNTTLVKIVLNNNSCKLLSFAEFSPFKQVIYIDDAFTLDLNNSLPFGPSYKSEGMMMHQGYAFPYSFRMSHKTDLLNSLLPNNDINLQRDLIDDINLDNDIKEYDRIIHEILHGEILYSDNSSSYVFQTLDKEINLSNVSSGMKAFGIIGLLVKNGLINANSCLILDEPESHLHPDWQIKLAKLLATMVAKSRITLLINSHSPFFIEAVQTYSKILHIDSKAKYYLSTNLDDFNSKLEDVTDNIVSIFDALANSYNILDREYIETIL